MQLDKIRIVVRERNFLDLMDLMLVVLRGHGPMLFVLWLLPVVFVMTINHWVLSGFHVDLGGEYEVAYDFFASYSLLMIWEMPLVTAPLTLYMGKILFDSRPSFRQIWGDFLRSLPQMLLIHGLLRGLSLLTCVGILLWFAFWPHVNEILLLERTSFWKKIRGINTWTRMGHLHSRNQGVVFQRWMGVVFVGGMLFSSFSLSLVWLEAMFGFQPNTEFLVYLQIPLIAWWVLGILSVFRFLGYLDLRIRNEGWELELALRAEGTRLQRRLI